MRARNPSLCDTVALKSVLLTPSFKRNIAQQQVAKAPLNDALVLCGFPANFVRQSCPAVLLNWSEGNPSEQILRQL